MQVTRPPRDLRLKHSHSIKRFRESLPQICVSKKEVDKPWGMNIIPSGNVPKIFGWRYSNCGVPELTSRFQKFRFTFALLAALILACPCVSGGIVLCIGLDGHVGTKSKAGGKCSGDRLQIASAPVLADPLSVSVRDNSLCSPCVDVPLPVRSCEVENCSEVTRHFNPKRMSRVAASIPTASATPAASQVLKLSAQNAPRVDLTLASLRTIVLLL